MKKLHVFLLLFFTASALFVTAQDTVYFKNGLMANGLHRYGREALYTDLLAYQLYTHTLQQPRENGVLAEKAGQQEIKWVAVTADSLNNFRMPLQPGMRGRGMGFFNSGYLYVTYTADKEKKALLNTMGSSSVYVNGALHTGDPYASGWLYIPIKLKKGLNEFYIRSGFRTTASLVFPVKPVNLNTEDPTLPVIGSQNNNALLQGAVVVINTSSKPLQHVKIKSNVAGNEMVSDLPVIPAMSTRKVPFSFNAGHVAQKGMYEMTLLLTDGNKTLDEKHVSIEVVGQDEPYSNTFVSAIDGSLQYYAVTPQSGANTVNAALFLSVHGAGVEAIGQARAYKPKDWGILVAATNRRPRGFNWEDWGRLDAMEVLNIAKEKFNPDPQRIYLTGHSMGGHGTWFLGAAYPELWAAIAPSAGYPTLKEYGSHDGKIPDSTSSAVEKILLQAGNQSDVVQLAENYKPLGVYIFHGDSDRVVSVNYARQMRKVLADFHTDFAYKEYPGGSHWFSNESVDWPPLFNFFKSHTILPDSAVNTIDFKTSSPGISSSYRWATIQQQTLPLQFSRIQLSRNLAAKTITGSTGNVQTLKLNVGQFGAGASITVTLDSLAPLLYTVSNAADSIWLQKQNNRWQVAKVPGIDEKGPQRYGTFKEAFNHNMVFVYGTKGNKAENEWAFNKARYDAETWYYRGNGAVDIIADKVYDADQYAGRNVILYGNASTNAVWQILLTDAPVQVSRNHVRAGANAWSGDDLAVYFTWPIKNSPLTSVGVVAGTGLKGMNAANANQYFAGGSGFPDYMIFRFDMLRDGSQAIELAGFFDNSWQMDVKNQAGGE
ncbi:prolyl oligopeptidase family serine peptidase [Agriterribacter sp.]|uniref:carboxylesterase family protein n=1 Tax=Agriterribacter sp. TaxID=2821509 RepID=UPI002C5B5B83|nr:prolyl oligopeptidase family serine peptidase [Agriterribacter sp.]HRO46430.1 prolyl oligopeptidase family serine peptidase [Agriterribacter sp.]HRQ17618.1 prolyl oligopeptidase family serine peptidase [Agriterribacter sp.]